MDEEKYRILVLTDHKTHKPQNSVYALSQEMAKNSNCKGIDVASRGDPANKRFFNQKTTKLNAASINKSFSFERREAFFSKTKEVSLSIYDFILLRLPPPVKKEFFLFLADNFPSKNIINQPQGILKTGTKKYLLKWKQFCPLMKLCKSSADIKAFARKFPIVLKPLEGYGGKGVVKIKDDLVLTDEGEISLQEFLEEYKRNPMDYLGMRYLKKVNRGDKRIIVINRKIVAAALRMPGKGSWKCNVAQGGIGKNTIITQREKEMLQELAPALAKEGILFFGMDTLVNDDGKRVLSEINVLSIGGLVDCESLSGKPVVKKASDLLWEYILTLNPNVGSGNRSG